MTLREYLAGRKESLKAFCVRKQIPYNRGRRYFYRIGMVVHIDDLDKIIADSSGAVTGAGITSEKRERIVYIGRGRPPKNVAKRTVKGKNAGRAA